MSTPIRAARRRLKALGLSYRQAAPILGVSYQHLSEVLNGGRVSKKLLEKIRGLAAQ